MNPSDSEDKLSLGRPRTRPEILNLNEHKAGLKGLDNRKINEVIQKASEGSNYYIFQEQRQKKIDCKKKELREKAAEISDAQRNLWRRAADEKAVQLEKKRDLSRIIVHLDMDMFFAAVEIRDRPELKDKPVVVGNVKGVVSTSNYVARKFGIRAAMAGYIAQRLCSGLVFVKPNFAKYQAVSEQVMNIIAEYDNTLSATSLDEAYFDLTDYVLARCKAASSQSSDSLSGNSQKSCSSDEGLPFEMWQVAFEVVEEIRKKIEDTTRVTASAGISSNSMLAKICTDVNKPNGQFMLIGRTYKIIDFIWSREVRKVPGIGPVTGQYLDAFDIKTCLDLWMKRDLVFGLWKKHAAKFYLRVSIGIASNHFYNDDNRKSKSCERTFGELRNSDEMIQKLEKLSQKLSKELIEENLKGKTITLKLKNIKFMVKIRSRTIKCYTNSSNEIFKTAKIILDQELSQMSKEEAKFRLIGVKVSNFEDENMKDGQLTLSGIFRNKKSNDQKNDKSQGQLYDDNFFQCPVCSEVFEEKLSFETHENKCVGDYLEDIEFTNSLNNSGEALQNINSEVDEEVVVLPVSIEESPSKVRCPVCGVTKLNEQEVDQHLDSCLSTNICRGLTELPQKTAQTSGRQSLCLNKTPNKRSPNSSSKKSSTKRKKPNDGKGFTQTTLDKYFN